MTPLRQDGGGRAVMVNRGWVPAEWRDSEDMRRSGQPGGKVGRRATARARLQRAHLGCVGSWCLRSSS